MKLTSTDPASHVKITEAGIVAVLVFAVGQLAAFVPSLAQYQATLISAGTAVVAAVFLIANAVHALAGSHTSLKVIEQDVAAQVKAELERILSAGIAAAPAGQGSTTITNATLPIASATPPAA